LLKVVNKLQINEHSETLLFTKLTNNFCPRSSMTDGSIYSQEGLEDIMVSRIIAPGLLVVGCRWDF
jgi:hypothetical protein